jgi:hypothetical protein
MSSMVDGRVSPTIANERQSTEPPVPSSEDVVPEQAFAGVGVGVGFEPVGVGEPEPPLPTAFEFAHADTRAIETISAKTAAERRIM